MSELDDLVAQQLLLNTPLQWLIAAAVAIVVYLVLVAARRFVRGYYTRLKATPRDELLEIPLGVLSRTTSISFFVWALYAGFQTLTYTPKLGQIADSIITISLFWQAGIWAVAAVGAWLDRKRRRSMEVDRAMVGSLGIIGFIINVVIWSMVLLLTLDNLGVDITALIAGLGIGGIAVALAVQNILSDLFASLSITLDRPFVVGDFLIVDEFLGSVEYIGIKSTRLRSLSGEQIVMSNADLLGSRVRNYGRMAERRVVFANSFPYETPIDRIEQIPALIKRIIESQPDTRFDRSHFMKHGAAAFEFETVYYVLSPDYNKYADTQQAINLQLHRELEKMGVKFAIPVQRLLIDESGKLAERADAKSATQSTEGSM
jgi:small-conductance mechanosensitive channel